MRDLRARTRGLSEIVGTLFLVLIVVAAATAFSVFVASYQAQLEQEQTSQHLRTLENMTVLHVAPANSSSAPSNPYWLTLNFTIASLWIDQSIITGIRINDQPVANYTAFGVNLSTGSYQSYSVSLGGNFIVGAHDQFWVQVDVMPGAQSSFYNQGIGIAMTSYIKVDLLTYYDNDFEQSFLPPSAVGVETPLQIFSAGAYITVPLLDASQSFQPGAGSIVSWNWTITSASPLSKHWGNGEKFVFSAVSAGSPSPVLYTVVLVVTDNNGLQGLTTFQFAY